MRGRDGGAAAWVDRWWRGEAGAAGRMADLALAPAELLFRAAAAAYHGAYAAGFRAATGAPIPAVSIGNLEVGGTGKTPVARWVVDELLRRRARPALLHGGYAEDEPMLHALWHPGVPVYSGHDRLASAIEAAAAGADVLVMDDAFQHRRLARELDVVLVSAERWTPRPRLLPRGPWREPPAAVRRADLVVVTRKSATADEARRVLAALRDVAPAVPGAALALRPDGWRRFGAEAGGGRIGDTSSPRGLLVCAIGEPEPFLANARATGATVTGELRFRDHHDYDAADARRIETAAGGGPILTTEKDAVKLAPLLPDAELWVLEQRVEVEEGGEHLARALDALVTARPGVA